MFKSYFSYFFIFIFLATISSCFLIQFLSYSDQVDYTNLDSNYLWPTPGYTTITSYFGYRTAPTTGAGTYHGGIDIGAPTRSKYYFCF